MVDVEGDLEGVRQRRLLLVRYVMVPHSHIPAGQVETPSGTYMSLAGWFGSPNTQWAAVRTHLWQGWVTGGLLV